MKCGIEIDINILVVTIAILILQSSELHRLFVGTTFSLSSHPDFAVISNKGLFLFYHLKVISPIRQCFFHLYLVSYQDRLRNPK